MGRRTTDWHALSHPGGPEGTAAVRPGTWPYPLDGTQT